MIENFEATQGRGRCCDRDYGGSHYHCGNCGEVSSMMGHFVTINNQKMADLFGLPVGFQGFHCAASVPSPPQAQTR